MLESIKRYFVTVLVLTGSGFALFTGASGPYQAPVQRGFFVLVMLPLVFLLVPSRLTRNEKVETVSAFILALASVAVMSWLLVNYERLYSEPFLEDIDIWFGGLGLVLVLESVRRTVGLGITLILIGFLLFAYFGNRIPIDELRHGGLDVETIVSIIFYGTDGVFGTPIGVCATFIIVIIMLGSGFSPPGCHSDH